LSAFGGIPEWIQAIATVAILPLTVWSLLILKKYAADTKRIADDSASQVERSYVPFLAVITKPIPGASKNENWFLENQGFGPALNIVRIRHFPDSNSQMLAESPIGARSDVRIDRFTADGFNQHGFTAEYESLSGKKYRTVVIWPNGEMQTKFEALPMPRALKRAGRATTI
jgi:hypothetical protein